MCTVERDDGGHYREVQPITVARLTPTETSGGLEHPLVRAKVKLTVKTPYAVAEDSSQSAFLTVILALTLKSGAGLRLGTPTWTSGYFGWVRLRTECG